MSPAKALYGRELKDFLPRPGSSLMGDLWIKLANAKEKGLGVGGRCDVEEMFSGGIRNLKIKQRKI